MATATQTAEREATIDDLLRVPGKAELIRGKVVHFSPTGGVPGYAGDGIFVALWNHARQTGHGLAVGDNKGFRVSLTHRKTFSPDAAFWVGAEPTMGFFEGAPVFAVEVRSENDYGPQAEREMTEKRADYFAAGTLVVWDVDLKSPEVIRKYRASDPANPVIFRRGEDADAEPAVPDWRIKVDTIFRR